MLREFKANQTKRNKKIELKKNEYNRFYDGITFISASFCFEKIKGRKNLKCADNESVFSSESVKLCYFNYFHLTYGYICG